MEKIRIWDNHPGSATLKIKTRKVDAKYLFSRKYCNFNFVKNLKLAQVYEIFLIFVERINVPANF
jgi:hypothetical protein